MSRAERAAARARRRASLVARIPGWYSPAVHLAVPTGAGLIVLAYALVSIDRLETSELLAIPATLLFSLGFEWWAHRSLLHRRAPLLGRLQVRHEREHHRVFTADDMALRSPRELWLVLMPAYSVVLVFVMLLPLVVGASWVFSRNAALLGLSTAMAFFLSYEWMHCAYHLPEDSFVYRLPWLARLREHHRRHHDPRLMKRWNFNVTVPVFDGVCGTLWSAGRLEHRSRWNPEKSDHRKRTARAQEEEGI